MRHSIHGARCTISLPAHFCECTAYPMVCLSKTFQYQANIVFSLSSATPICFYIFVRRSLAAISVVWALQRGYGAQLGSLSSQLEASWARNRKTVQNSTSWVNTFCFDWFGRTDPTSTLTLSPNRIPDHDSFHAPCWKGPGPESAQLASNAGKTCH